MPLDFTTMPSRRRGSSPAARWGRARATSGTGRQLGSPLADWWRWRGRGELRRAAATRPRRHARGHTGSGKARGGEAQCVAREVREMSREGLGRLRRRRARAEQGAHRRRRQWRGAAGTAARDGVGEERTWRPFIRASSDDGG
jgi:hypothetical protein